MEEVWKKQADIFKQKYESLENNINTTFNRGQDMTNRASEDTPTSSMSADVDDVN